MHILYLHGFASSPGSKKANFFKPHVEAAGGSYSIPDLNAPSFSQLMLTAMLERVAATIRALPDDVPVGLVGSSMGGLTAVNFMDRYRHAEAQRVQKILLLAPAFEFLSSGDEALFQRWQAAGEMAFFNYAANEERAVHFQLVQDARGYDSYSVTIDCPMLIFHGRQDESVSYKQSERFAASRDNVTLHVLESDHQLLDQTEYILSHLLDFFDWN